MARYRFHCTNGSVCVFDAKGTDIPVPSRWASKAAFPGWIPPIGPARARTAR
jgi:hypothetical protein